MEANDVSYNLFCSNCKCITPHSIDNKVEETEQKIIAPSFLNELFNFLFSINALDTDEMPYICSFCKTRY
jgi:hypothetical protein